MLCSSIAQEPGEYCTFDKYGLGYVSLSACKQRDTLLVQQTNEQAKQAKLKYQVQHGDRVPQHPCPS